MNSAPLEISAGGEYTEKKSRFLGFFAGIDSVAAAVAMVAALKKEHKKAAHVCYAYRVAETSESIPVCREKASGDGEPGGVGSALLGLLKNGGHENCALVVVRYWGGTLLGAGNLVRAYAKAGKAALGVGAG